MASSKYGRLFTEADVKLALAHAIEEAWRRDGVRQCDPTVGSITEHVLDELPTTFPADVPLFLLTATDRAASETVAFYRGEARRFNLDIKHDEAVLAALDAMRAWQAAHPAQVTEP